MEVHVWDKALQLKRREAMLVSRITLCGKLTLAAKLR